MTTIGDFPKLPGGGPMPWGSAALAAGGLALILLPSGWTLLGVNAFILSAVLWTVVAGRPWLKKSDSSIVLGAVVVMLIALYGGFHEFGRYGPWVNFALVGAAAGLLYAARRLWAFRFARKSALAFAATLATDQRLEFADACRTFHRRRIGALSVAADIFRDVAEEALRPNAFIRPAHVRAVQNYSHMLLFGEAKGTRGEGEWFAKQAQKLGRKLLESQEPDRTLH